MALILLKTFGKRTYKNLIKKMFVFWTKTSLTKTTTRNFN